MRNILVALLIVMFSVVHSAAAFGVLHMDASGIEHSTAVDHDHIEADDKSHSHHMKCCEKASDTSSGSKLPDCGADCVSFIVSNIDLLFATSASPEHHRTPLLFALPSLPQDHPPKHI